MKLALTSSLAVVAVSALSQNASEWKFAGYLDFYYQYDLNRPASGNSVNGRGFDIAHHRIRLANAELDASLEPTAKRPWGVNLQLMVGKNADLINFTEPGGKDRYKLFRQAYVTYADAKSGWKADLGKFDTWIGYEGVDTRSQEQYSRSFNWTYSEPTYETGLRFSGKLNEKVSLALFLVQGWNEVKDGNGSPSVGAQFTISAGPRTTVVLQNHYGKEGSSSPNDAGSYGGIGFANPGTSTVHLLDGIVTHQINEKTKVAFNVDYGNATGGLNVGKWNGEVLYLTHAANAKHTHSLRFERFEDADGLRAGVPIILHSLVGGHEWKAFANGIVRFEVRHDRSSKAFFNGRSGLETSRTTLGAALILKF